MAQGSSGSATGDILLQRDRTRFVPKLSVYDEDPQDDVVRGDASSGEFLVRANDSTGASPDIQVRTQTASPAGFFGMEYGRGAAWVNAPDGGSVVQLDAGFDGDGQVTVRNPRRTNPNLARLATGEGGGRLQLFSSEDSQPVVRALARQGTVGGGPGGGRLEVSPPGSPVTGRLSGNDATLLLRSPSGGSGSGDPPPDPSLVLQRYASRDVPENVLVHFDGEDSSDYGADAGNPPRIHVDGYEGRLDVGRGPVDDRYDGFAGSIELRGSISGQQRPVVAARAATTGPNDEERTGRILLRNDDGGTVTVAGSIDSDVRGLVLREGSGAPGLLIGTGGTIETASSIARGTLPAVGPTVVENNLEVARGDPVTFVVTVGDDDTFSLSITDTQGSAYLLEATVAAGADARLPVTFDTAAAADPSQRSVTIGGDATLTVDNESVPSGSLPAGPYDISVADGNDSGGAYLRIG